MPKYRPAPHLPTPSDAGSQTPDPSAEIFTPSQSKSPPPLVVIGISLGVLVFGVGIWFGLRLFTPSGQVIPDATSLTQVVPSPQTARTPTSRPQTYHYSSLGVSFRTPANTTICEADQAILINHLDNVACDQFRQSPPSTVDYPVPATSGSHETYQVNDQTAIVNTANNSIVITTNGQGNIDQVLDTIITAPSPTPASQSNQPLTGTPTSSPTGTISPSPTTTPASSFPTPTPTISKSFPDLPPDEQYIEYW